MMLVRPCGTPLTTSCRDSGNFTSRNSSTILALLPLEDEYPFAGGLGVEETVGLFGLVEVPAMGEEAAQRNLAVGDEARALLLAGIGERPRGVERDLAPQQILADVERDAVALADEGDAAPGVGAAHRLA